MTWDPPPVTSYASQGPCRNMQKRSFSHPCKFATWGIHFSEELQACKECQTGRTASLEGRAGGQSRRLGDYRDLIYIYIYASIKFLGDLRFFLDNLVNLRSLRNVFGKRPDILGIFVYIFPKPALYSLDLVHPSKRNCKCSFNGRPTSITTRGVSIMEGFNFNNRCRLLEPKML